MEQTQPLSPQMETSIQNAHTHTHTQLNMLAHFGCALDTHTHHLRVLVVNSLATPQSTSRGICQCHGLFGFPGDIKVAWLHVLGANDVCVLVLCVFLYCVWGVGGQTCYVKICFCINFILLTKKGENYVYCMYV